MAVTLEALPRDVKVGMQLYDENGNAFEIVGIGTMTWQAAERGEIELLIKGGSPLGKRLKLA